MLASERRQTIAQLVQQNGTITVRDLCTRLSVSPATIRRDLASLAEDRLIQRAFGGAMTGNSGMLQLPVIQRARACAEEKQRIGLATAALVADGETVFLGTGTTTLEVAKILCSRKRLTVITNALNIANFLAPSLQIEVIILGGFLRHSEYSIIGHLTEICLKELHADKAIVGMKAISVQHGLSNEYLSETLTDRAILAFCDHVILVADHSKLDKVSTCVVAPLSAAHTLVTDSGISPQQLAELRAAGLDIIVA